MNSADDSARPDTLGSKSVEATLQVLSLDFVTAFQILHASPGLRSKCLLFRSGVAPALPKQPESITNCLAGVPILAGLEQIIYKRVLVRREGDGSPRHRQFSKKMRRRFCRRRSIRNESMRR
jgi:hypothetical protein